MTYEKTKIKIGEGSFAKVYKGYDSEGSPVAVKVYNEKERKKPRQIDYEKIVARKLPAHDNIVRILHYENHCIYMEFCKGESVQHLLTRHLENKFGLDVYSCYKAILDIHAGYFHIRQFGFAHRDIKPANVMVHYSPDGTMLFKIGDFGATKRNETETGSSQKLTSLVGDEDYCSPAMRHEMIKQADLKKKGKSKLFGVQKDKEAEEQFEFSENIDMWSIGATIVDIVCSHKPFTANTDDQMLMLYENRKPDTIMADSNGSDNPKDHTQVSRFLPICHVSHRASKGLQDAMLKIVRYLLQLPEKQNLEELRSLIEDLKEKGIHYKLNLTNGYGEFELGKPKTLPWLKSKAIEQFRKALNLVAPVGFEYSSEDPTEDPIDHVSRAFKTVSVRKNENDHAAKDVVNDYCRSLASLCRCMRNVDIDMQLLRHLALTNMDNDLTTELTDRISVVDGIVKQVLTRDAEVKVIYQEHFELESEVLLNIIKQLKNWTVEMKSQVQNHRELAANTTDGAIIKLCHQLIRGSDTELEAF